MQKILIDTDPGQDIDDLLAIVFALKRPELDVKAITTATYPTDKRARMIRRLLRHLDRRDIAVAAGMNLPLRRMSEDELRSQHDLKATMNHYAFAEPEDPLDEPGDEDAVELIIRTVEENPGEIALACIAPLTNIACALRRRPEIAPKIKYIALMGGELALNRAEHNIAFDYIAADIVLNSGVPLFMGTGGPDLNDLPLQVGKVAAILLVIIVLARWVIPALLYRVTRQKSRDLFFVTIAGWIPVLMA